MAVATFEKIWRKKKGPTFADLPGFEDIWNNKSAVLVEPEPALVSTEFAPSSISGAPLTAGEIAEDKADEQRNIQMAFIREHPELIQQTQRKEEDQLIDDFFSKLPEPKTDYDKRLRLSNMRLALEGEPKSYHRKVYLARAKRAKIKEMQEQGLILDERQQYKGFWNELGRNTAGGGLNVASGLLGTLASVSEGAIWDKDKIEEWAQKLHKLSSKPAYTAAKEGGWKGFVAASIGQALPYMGAALASVLVTGQPYAAFGVGFSVEGDNAYRDALAAGATEEEAQMNRLIVGTINGAIEQIQVGQIFKFARAGRGSMRAISKAAQDRAMKKIAKIGGKLTLDSLYHAARESLEEVLQETTSIAAESRVNPEVWNNAIERIVQSGLGGGVVGLAFGTAGAVRTHVAHPIETVIKPAMYALGLDKKSREFKEFALTREGSEIVAAMSPELATRLAAKEQPSRADLKELGVSGWNAKERAQLSSFFRDALEDQERMASNQRAIEQLEEAVAWQQREAETAPTVPIAEPTEAVAARKPAEVAEIPPKAAEAKPEAVEVGEEVEMPEGVKKGDTFREASQNWKVIGLGQTTGGDIGILAETERGQRVIFDPDFIQQKLAKPPAKVEPAKVEKPSEPAAKPKSKGLKAKPEAKVEKAEPITKEEKNKLQAKGYSVPEILKMERTEVRKLLKVERPKTPKVLKKPLSELSNKELESRSKKASPFHEKYMAEIAWRKQQAPAAAKPSKPSASFESWLSGQGARNRAAIEKYIKTGDMKKALDAYKNAGEGLYGGEKRAKMAVEAVIQFAKDRPDYPAKPAAAKPKSKGLKEKPTKEAKRVISKEAYEKAKKRLTDNTTFRTGVDPQGLADMLTIGAYHFETGIREFADWANKMIEEFGEKVRPHLLDVYDKIATERKPKKGTKARREFEAETRERGFITSVKEEFPKMADKVAGQYIPRSTDKLSIKAKNLIKDDIEAAEELAKTGTNDLAVATASELIIHYNKLAETTKDQAAEKTFYEKAADIAHPAAANLTELGRAVQAASILGRMTPEGQLRVAAKTINDYNAKVPKKLIGRKKIPQLAPEQTKEILKRARAIEKMPDGEAKAKAFWELQNYISELVPTPLWKKIINVWKAGLLTGIKTSGLNTFSNLAHGISEVVKDVPATGFDIMFSLVTKKRTIGLTARGVPSGLKKGAVRGWRYLKTGFDERNVAAKLDYHRVSMGKGKFAKAVGAYTDAIFRMMGAEDQPFYYGALARSLSSQAIAEAKNKGLKGKEAKTYIENLVENPTDTMLNYAVNDALIAVYQNQTMLGKIGKKFQEMPVVGEVIAPFVRTPSAVAMQIIHYSPIGLVKTAIENIGEGKFDQRLLSQGLARGLLGTGILYLGTQLFVMGLMALGRPKGEREKKLWEIEGRKPNSIKVGGKWRDVQVLGPIGPVLLIGGYFQQALESTGSPTEAMATAIMGGAKSFSEQTFVRGVNAAASAVADPERSFDLFFASLAGSMVPTIISDVARTMDTTERRSKGTVQRIQVRIPGLREQLEPRIDVFGNDLPRYGGNVYEVMLDPTRPFKVNEDVVVDELRRLWDKGHKVSPTQLGYKYGYEFLTPEENTEMWYAVGSLTYEHLHLLIRKPEYRRASDEAKAKAIEKKVDKVKEQIKRKFRIKQREEAFEKESEK